MEELVRFSVTMEAELLGRFDALVARRGTRANRSEAVRDLVREALVEHRVENPDAEIAGTITMVFDHHESELSDRLNAIQHQYIHEIVSTVHVHLDSRNCLEVIVMRGGQCPHPRHCRHPPGDQRGQAWQARDHHHRRCEGPGGGSSALAFPCPPP